MPPAGIAIALGVTPLVAGLISSVLVSIALPMISDDVQPLLPKVSP